MSLGWQTESALLPSKAKPIKVNNKTLINLKSFVYQKEQQQKLDRQQQNSNNRFNHLSATKRFQSKNTAPDSKIAETDISATEKASLALSGKAKLYDKLMREDDAVDVIGLASLIDFSRKRQHEEVDNAEEELLRAPDSALSSSSAPIYQVQGSGQWQWSRGSGTAGTHDNDEAAYIAKNRTERELQRAAESAIEHAIVSHGARVKSQWEKNLNSDAKQLALQLHIDTETHRQQQRQADSNAISQSNSSGGKNMREERLEMLKRKRQKLGFDPSAAPTSSSTL